MSIFGDYYAVFDLGNELPDLARYSAIKFKDREDFDENSRNELGDPFIIGLTEKETRVVLDYLAGKAKYNLPISNHTYSRAVV